MGYNAYNYIGAYIEMPTVEKEINKTIRRCSNKACSNHKNEKMSSSFKFCNQCGKEIEEFSKKEVKTTIPDYYSFAEDNGFDPEEFSQVQNNREVLIPNRRFGSIEYWDENEEIAYEFNTQDTQKAIEEYIKVAQPFIDKFKEIYNIELKVKFGVVSYIM